MRRCVVAISVLGLLAAQVALAAGAPSPSGTWSGRFVFVPHDGIPLDAYPPLSTYPTAKLVVGQAWVTAQFSGITMATHDPPDARSTCSMRLRFSNALSSGGWRTYEQAGKVGLSSSHPTAAISPAIARTASEKWARSMRRSCVALPPVYFFGHLIRAR